MTLETILRTVLHAAAWSALVAFCGVVATVGVCSMLRLLCHALAETGRTCGKFVAMTLASLALVCAVVGGGKALNGPPDGVSASARVMSTARGAPETCLSSLAKAQRSATAPETCLRGPANAPETLPPHLAALGSAVNAQDVPRWELRGAYDDAIRIPAMGWDFRTPDGFVEGMTVLSRGEFRPDVGHLYFPRPFTNDLSLLPRSRWGLLPGGGESRLWYAATPSNSLLVTWVNGLVDRNPLTPTNFQAEFFPDGSYEYRYGATSLPREPVTLPFDWDVDGLENTVDPEPLVAGPDAHNTNAEWYGIVCSGVFERIERDDSSQVVWRDEVNPDAYYFVDVVVDHGPVPIYFNALNDGGDLGSPVVVATGGVTNHVPLLLGVTYAVTSDVPVAVSLPEGCFAAVATNDALNLTVSWPLEYWFMEMGEGSHAYYVGFSPRDPGGVFRWSWERDAGTGGASLMSGAPELLPRCFSAVGGYVWADCVGGCGCGGCQAEGTYRYAGRTVTISGGDCGCVPHPPPPPEPPFISPPTVSVGFSSPAIIYEDAYDNTPTNHVPRRSSGPVTLTVDASGGTYGTTLTLTQSNMDKLQKLSQWTLPFGSIHIPANDIVHYTVVYDAQSPSAAENDITLQATVADRVNGGTITSCATTMVVRVELETKETVTGNTYSNRHRYGVCETIRLKHKPESACIAWRIRGNGVNEPSIINSGCYELELPASLMYFNGLVATCANIEYSPLVTLLEPTGVLCTGFAWNEMTKGSGNARKNSAGYVGMYLTLHVLPQDVSFGGIDFAELPSTEESHTSYYNFLEGTGYISHTTTAGAGVWHKVGANNYFCRDEAVTRNCPPVWIDESRHTWAIPHCWRRHEEIKGLWLPNERTDGTVAHEDAQVFTLDSQGTVAIFKHGKTVSRTTNNCVRVGGDVVYGSEN